MRNIQQTSGRGPWALVFVLWFLACLAMANMALDELVRQWYVPNAERVQ